LFETLVDAGTTGGQGIFEAGEVIEQDHRVFDGQSIVTVELADTAVGEDRARDGALAAARTRATDQAVVAAVSADAREVREQFLDVVDIDIAVAVEVATTAAGGSGRGWSRLARVRRRRS
jgi:hypothetical protein